VAGQFGDKLRIVGEAGGLAAVAADDVLGPGVEEQLGRVEALALLGCPRAVGAQAIHDAGPAAGQEAVPHALAAGGELQPGLLDVAVVVEQA